MIVLGMHFGHDAAVTLLKDGVVLVYLEKERRNRVKHTIGLDYDDVRFVLEQAKIGPENVDFCAVTSTQDIEYLFFEPDKLSFVVGGAAAKEVPSPYAEQILSNGGSLSNLDGRTVIRDIYKNKTEHFYRSLLRQYKRLDLEKVVSVPSTEDFIFVDKWRDAKTLVDIAKSNYTMLLNDTVARGFHLPITVTIEGCTLPGALFSHHYAHAAYSYYESSFSCAAVLSHDGGSARRGYRAGMFYFGEGERLYPLTPHYLSQGSMYYTVAEKLGLGSSGGSGKLMGLAAYGQPRFYNQDFVGNWYDKPLIQESKHPQQWLQYVLSRAEQEGYDLTPFGDVNHITEPVNADIAASTQKVFEETILCAVEALSGVLKSSSLRTQNLCLGGGTTLNCPANTRIFVESQFANVFAPPGCDDSGLAIGAAYALYYNVLGFPRSTQKVTRAEQVYRGRLYGEEDISLALKEFEDAVKVEMPDDPAKAAAAILHSDGIIGWFERRSELGPRALGHRSIIANPSNKDNWRRVNRIKRRESWRPLAPSVLVDQVDHWFNEVPVPSPYMLFNAKVISEKIPATTHVDGTARIQTVSPENGLYFRLLQAFHELSGIPVVLNTSFNGPGEPIVESPSDALRFFVNSELDALFINGIKILKKSQAICKDSSHG
jgi:carbamoyltransferase